MATYHNPQPTQEVNYTDEHPLKEFFQLLAGVGALVLVVILLINAFAEVIARQIPFEFEQRMVADLDINEFIDVESSATQQELQRLADKLTPHMDLPDGMRIKVYYSAGDTVNAFATLGGNLVFFRGLLDRLESEEELAAVMGHEIAHVKLRHPIVALGKGVMLGTMAAFVSGASGSTAGDWLIGSSTQLGLMKFSRDQERASDLEAARALYKVYGNVRGARELFDKFEQIEAELGVEKGDSKLVEMFRSHPYSSARWSALEAVANEEGWPVGGQLTPLVIPE